MHEILVNPFIILYPGFVMRILLATILFGEKKIHYYTAIRESLKSAYVSEAVNPDSRVGNLIVAFVRISLEGN